MYTYRTKVKIHEGDAAGWLFFGNVFKIAHDAYEAFMDSVGMSIADFIKEDKFIMPIAHAEADYKKPQFAGESLTIILHCEKIGKSSYTIAYDILNHEGETAYTVKTVHVALDAKTRKIIRIPQELKNALEGISCDS